MTIKIVKEPDVTLTQSEYNRYMDEYRKAFMFYCGTPPTFNAWVAERLKKRGWTEDEQYE